MQSVVSVNKLDLQDFLAEYFLTVDISGVSEVSGVQERSNTQCNVVIRLSISKSLIYSFTAQLGLQQMHVSH